MSETNPSSIAAAGKTLQPSKVTSNTSSQGESSKQPAASEAEGSSAPKKKRHRAGKKRRKNRRQSFAAPSEEGETPLEPFPEPLAERTNLQDVPEHQETPGFYQLGNRATRSSTSLDSDVLLDHRQQEDISIRRPSLLQQAQNYRAAHLHPSRNLARDQSQSTNQRGSNSRSPLRARTWANHGAEEDEEADDRTPLMQSSRQTGSRHGYGGFNTPEEQRSSNLRRRRTSASSANERGNLPRQMSSSTMPAYDVNNPPSVPGSPRYGDDNDVTMPDFQLNESPVSRKTHDAIIDIDEQSDAARTTSRSPPPEYRNFRRRQSLQSPVLEDDVCVPFDRMSEIGEEEEEEPRQQEHDYFEPRRSRRRPWPDLSALEEWSQQEKEERTMEGVRAKKVSEPVLVEGRLRPRRGDWQREEEEAPFRWTYFNEELDSSLRSHTISGLQQLGLSFRELFNPDAPEIEDDSSDDEADSYAGMPDRLATPVGTRQSSIIDVKQRPDSKAPSSEPTPLKENTTEEKPKKYGQPPVFWLDVLQPTYEEMRVISRAFGIHKLTAEDIMEQEAREKLELFRTYYFVNYRTFEQDIKSEDYMDPVNFYFVVFKGGVISFHFSQLPHPPNVRRRIRQLAEHQYTDSDWISYAIIDNITDAYAPVIEKIEQEVDDIDEDILQMHRQADARSRGDEKKASVASKSTPLERSKSIYEKLNQIQQMDSDVSPADKGRDMLLRVGECRKQVMSLYRLLGNKADVIKGLAKRCTEQWQIASRSDVGLYLGDIQDHIVTMTGNLTHYENMLARAHSNYLAQINIAMNERAEKTTDILNKLTVLGTIVLPMNIITGMWGMNVLVPGQDVPTLWWFWGITFGLVMFGCTCFFVAKKSFGIV